MLLVEVFVFWAVPVRLLKRLWNASSYSKFHDCALLQVFDTIRQASLIGFVNLIKAGSADLIWIVDLKSDLTSTAAGSQNFVVTGEAAVVALGFLQVRRDISGPEGLPLPSAIRAWRRAQHPAEVLMLQFEAGWPVLLQVSCQLQAGVVELWKSWWDTSVNRLGVNVGHHLLSCCLRSLFCKSQVLLQEQPANLLMRRTVPRCWQGTNNSTRREIT